MVGFAGQTIGLVPNELACRDIASAQIDGVKASEQFRRQSLTIVFYIVVTLLVFHLFKVKVFLGISKVLNLFGR